METIAELEKYLEKECYSFQEISIGKHHAPEGIVIEKEGDRYNFITSERGNKEIMKSFMSEKELVDFTLEVLKGNRWYKAHLVAYVWNESEIKSAEKELKEMNINFERNDIPNYSKGKHAYRIFVFGRDVLLLKAFKMKYIWYHDYN